MTPFAKTPGQIAKDEAEVQAIVRAAYKLMGQGDGASASAIHAILAEAGLARRAFYRHFASKDDLIIAMFRFENESVASALEADIAAAPTLIDAVEAWIDHWLAVIYDPARLRHIRVLASRAAQVDGLRAVRQESYDVAIDALARLLALGREGGDFPLTEPMPDARAIHAAMIALLEARLSRAYTPNLRDARSYVCRLVGRVCGAPAWA